MGTFEKVKKFADEMSEAVSSKLPDPKKIDEKARGRLRELEKDIKKL